MRKEQGTKIGYHRNQPPPTKGTLNRPTVPKPRPQGGNGAHGVVVAQSKGLLVFTRNTAGVGRIETSTAPQEGNTAPMGVATAVVRPADQGFLPDPISHHHPPIGTETSRIRLPNLEGRGPAGGKD
jgi:hypothetical protein